MFYILHVFGVHVCAVWIGFSWVRHLAHFTRVLETHICDNWCRESDAKDVHEFMRHFYTIQLFVPCCAVFTYVGERSYMYRWYFEV